MIAARPHRSGRAAAAASLLLAALFAGAIGCSEDPATGLVVEVSTSYDVPRELNRVIVRVTNASGRVVLDQTFDLGPGKYALPERLALKPSTDDLGPITVEALGYRDTTQLVSRRATLSFERARVLLLRLPLLGVCQGRTCPEGQTCQDDGRCDDQTIPPRRLPTYTPNTEPAPAAPDGSAQGQPADGPPAGRDAAADARTVPVTDAPGVDGPLPPGPDAPPGLRAVGAACTAASQCASGSCQDGVCCADACAGGCRACARAKTGKEDGQCAPVTAGTDPDNECAPDAVNRCGLDGQCDGAGACRLRPRGTECAAAACSAGAFLPARTCDGQGVCQEPAPSACGAYACTTSGCKTACQGNGDCVAPYACVASMCGNLKPNGMSCGSGAECSSGQCIDGVCCENACTGSCKSCLQSKTGRSNGVCAAVTAGTDPDNDCDVDTNPCGRDGTCDGAGACRVQPATVKCASASCNGTAFTPDSYCDGAGTCKTATAVDCGNRACTSSGCQASANGQPCSTGATCSSTFCVDGVCCDTTCNNFCQSCNQASAPGKCQPVTNAVETDRCTAPTGSYCNAAGQCVVNVFFHMGTGTPLASFTFPDTKVGQSTTVMFYIERHTSAVVTDKVVLSIQAGAGDYTLIDGCSLKDLPPGPANKCAFMVKFAPVAAGTRTGDLTGYDFWAEGATVTNLRGTGVP